MTSETVLVADVGGTRARFALLGAGARLTRRMELECASFPSLAAACHAYLESAGDGVAPTAAGIALAAPVLGDRVDLTNRAWSFSIEEMRRELGLERLEVLNDFAALALSLTLLGEDETEPIRAGHAIEGAPIGLLGPGTGLGMAALIRHGDLLVPIATEGGHQDLAATTDREWQIQRWLSRRYGHVSIERVLSGPGLANLQAAIGSIDGHEASDLLAPEAVVAGARAQRRDCLEAVTLFAAWLGAAAGDLALSLGARGGIYVGGGVVPRMGTVFDADAFCERFLAKGRFRDYLSPIPVRLVLRTESALAGVALWMSRSAVAGSSTT